MFYVFFSLFPMVHEFEKTKSEIKNICETHLCRLGKYVENTEGEVFTIAFLSMLATNLGNPEVNILDKTPLYPQKTQ